MGPQTLLSLCLILERLIDQHGPCVYNNDIHNIQFTIFSNDSGFIRLRDTINVLAPAKLDIENRDIPFAGEREVLLKSI